MAPEPTDQELHLWASELYENEDLEEECNRVEGDVQHLFARVLP